MQAQITVRLDEAFHAQLTHVAKRLRRKRSEVVRLALEKFISEIGSLEEPKPYDQVKDLIGSVESGFPDLGQAHRAYLVKKFKKNA